MINSYIIITNKELVTEVLNIKKEHMENSLMRIIIILLIIWKIIFYELNFKAIGWIRWF